MTTHLRNARVNAGDEREALIGELRSSAGIAGHVSHVFHTVLRRPSGALVEVAVNTVWTFTRSLLKRTPVFGYGGHASLCAALAV